MTLQRQPSLGNEGTLSQKMKSCTVLSPINDERLDKFDLSLKFQDMQVRYRRDKSGHT